MTADKTDSIERYRANLQGEVDGAALYKTLAQTEQDPHLAEVYRRLAAVEEAHAEFWRKQFFHQLRLSMRHNRSSIVRYIEFYNSRRPHRAHKGRTPDAAYFGNQDIKAGA